MLTQAPKSSYEWLHYLRFSNWGKSVFAYLYEGDLGVKIFWIIAGFLVSYLYFLRPNRNISFELLKKEFYVIFAATTVLVTTMLCTKLCEYLPISMTLDYSLHALKSDVLIILFKEGTPYYAYQLWYIRSVVIGYAMCYAYLGIFGEHTGVRWIGYIGLIFVLFKYDYSLFSIALGLVLGDVAAWIKNAGLIEKIPKWTHWLWGILGFICMCIGPVVYNEDTIAVPEQKFRSIEYLSICVGMAVMAFWFCEMTGKQKTKPCRVLDWLDQGTFPVYLLQVLIFEIVTNNLYIWLNGTASDAVLILGVFAVTIVMLGIFSWLFTRFILNFGTNVFRKCYKFIETHGDRL
jgi:peptidoglycan/LPS O-acetylase OafA/YrhL